MKEAQRKYYKNKVKQKIVIFTAKDIDLYNFANTINFNKVVKEMLKNIIKEGKQ